MARLNFTLLGVLHAFEALPGASSTALDLVTGESLDGGGVIGGSGHRGTDLDLFILLRVQCRGQQDALTGIRQQTSEMGRTLLGRVVQHPLAPFHLLGEAASDLLGPQCQRREWGSLTEVRTPLPHVVHAVLLRLTPPLETAEHAYPIEPQQGGRRRGV